MKKNIKSALDLLEKLQAIYQDHAQGFENLAKGFSSEAAELAVETGKIYAETAAHLGNIREILLKAEPPKRKKVVTAIS